MMGKADPDQTGGGGGGGCGGGGGADLKDISPSSKDDFNLHVCVTFKEEK